MSTKEHITTVDAPKFVEGCILEYGTATIEDRAIPDDFAGQKPSQRRLVVAMNDGRMYPGTAFRKSAKAVADAMGCLTGDTRVLLLDGTNSTIRELAKHRANDLFGVYAVNQQGRVVAGVAHSPRLTKRTKKLVELVYDDGTVVRCTTEHHIRRSDGTYVPARELRVGDSMMVVARARHKGYERVRHPHYHGDPTRSGGWQYTHHIVLPNLSKGMHRHHKDNNPLNNEPAARTIVKYTKTKVHRKAKSRLMGSQNINPGFQLRAQNGKVLKYVKSLLDSGKPLTQAVYKDGQAKCPSWAWVLRTFGTVDKLQQEATRYNHTLISVRRLRLRHAVAVYDLSVEKYHNLCVALNDGNGAVIANSYHPHGDSGLYSALVGLTHDRYPWVEGQGNFGNPLYGTGVNADIPPASMRYCVTGDTLIETARGWCRIDEMKAVVPELVSSLDGDQRRASRWFDSGVQPVVRVTTRHGFRITATTNEPLLVLTPDLEMVWRDVDDLQIGDVLCINRARASTAWPRQLQLPTAIYEGLGVPQPKALPETMTPELARVLGYLVAEGWVTAKRVSFINKCPEVIADFKRCWDEVFPDTRLHEFHHVNDYDCIVLDIHAQRVTQFLGQLGLAPVKSAHKAVPWSVLQADQASVVAFLAAYFEGDGSADYSWHDATSRSRKLLAQVQLMLLKFGIVSIMQATRRLGKHKGWRLRLTGENQELFDLRIGFISNRKRELPRCQPESRRPHLDVIPYAAALIRQRFAERRVKVSQVVYYRADDGQEVHIPWQEKLLTQGLTQRADLVERLALFADVDAQLGQRLKQVCDAPYLFDPVVSLRPRGKRSVFDLSVDETHAFTGNGIVCHNTEIRLSK